MKVTETLAAQRSPTKAVNFQRGNSRVVAIPSPRSNYPRTRNSPIAQKYLAAQQQSRKPSNPIKTTKRSEDDEWQDIDDGADSAGGGQVRPVAWPQLNPPPQAEARSTETRPAAEVTPIKTKPNPASTIPNLRHQDALAARDARGAGSLKSANASDVADLTETGNTSSSFLSFSPNSAGANLIRKLGEQGRFLKLSSWRSRRIDEPSLSEEESLGRSFYRKPAGNNAYPAHPTEQYTYPSQSQASDPHRKPFWLDPQIPGLIELYVQVTFNTVMVGALLYAIGVFYLTIRNDVNLKVEEYSVDIIDQIAKCSFEYIRNGCEPGKRVPAIEAACQQWERCMQRDPKEVGRAKVSAETFGTIIEAFIQPIGLKSMIFVTAIFAGSFLLVNGVFSSRFSSRFNGSHHFAGQNVPQQQQQYTQTIPPQIQSQSQYATMQNSIYSPSHVTTPRFHISSPRYRQQPNLQSSPNRGSPYRYL